ncbi:MAG TPA: response regulator [Gemmataceae bacterium]|jgi:signal transduction histidine kinase|nr:response regulator [Gemmataceae bacterium]
MKILVAEDNHFYRRMLEATLTEWGYQVLATDEGLAAWQVLQQKDAPKLAILDWMMPGMDGLELCRKVRGVSRPEPTYIILLTAKGGRENIIAGLEGGADDYISKPFDREELHARLQVGLRIVGLQTSLAARVRELEDALSGAQKMEAIGRLAGGVAHDFNNLLTVIITGSEVLLNNLHPDERQSELIQMIKQSGERGASLTRQLLAFSRKQVLAPVVLDLNALIANLEKMLRRLIGEDIDLVTSLDPALGTVEADPGQVEQVIMNLAVNARDAMPGGGRLTIETRNVELDDARGPKRASWRPGPYAVLAVSDTGCGMDDATRSRIFEPFFTTKELGKGTGLGLATVYGVVQQSGGRIEVDSEPGQGATFKIYLPRVERPAPAPEPTPPPAASPSGRETVLLVEDEDPVRVMAREILRLNSYTVLEAANGGEALRIGQQCPDPIHLMLTDVVMPQINGPQVAERLAALRPEMKVLYMSGYADGEIVRQHVLEPGMPFLQKPFMPGVLANKVREVLNQ